MINISKPIQIEVKHHYVNKYEIDGLTLIESDGTAITFNSYAQMATYLGLTRQGLYHKIRTNMTPIDKLLEKLKKSR